MIDNIFVELGAILIIAAVIAGVTRLLRQPLIISYLLTGIVVSPYFLNIVHSTETISSFAQVGVSLLLFMVGLNLNPRIIKEVGRVSLIAGVGQVVFTSLIGFFLVKALGFSIIASLYISVALTFSSTIIIMKLLSDKGDLETLYGRISIGFLLVQDLIAVFLLMIISSLQGELNLASLVFWAILKGIILLGIILLVGVYFLPKITKIIARSQEFLLLFSISWCLALASLFFFLNFSFEIGALLAGVTLALSPYRYEISSKMKPLRDFFIILFFILLGSQIGSFDLGQHMASIIILSLFVLIGNPLIVMVLIGLLGYSKRTGFLAGLTVAQISEFSIILVALGVKVGHLTEEILSLVIIIGLITIMGSTYLILYANRIYQYVFMYLNVFEKNGKKIDEHKFVGEKAHEMILFGYNRIGYGILNSFRRLKKKFLVVDYNPEVIEKLGKLGINCTYGDADDSEFLEQLGLSKVRLVVSTIPAQNTNLLLIRKIRDSNKKAIIIVVSHKIDEAMDLYDEGATYVIMPHFLGGHHASAMIERYKLDYVKFLKEKVAHVKSLKERKELKHEHPKHERD